MKITHVSSYLDGGTTVITCDNRKRYYIDDRLHTKTKGEVFDAYPSGGNIIPKSELWELIMAIKDYEDIEYRHHMLHLLGTA